MGKGLEQTLLQGGHTEGPETYEKMLSITSYQRDANLNHNEIPPHTIENGLHKQSNKQQVLERLWRKGTLVHVVGIVDWCNHYGKQYGISSEN